jgi:hypothetical protein
VEHGGQKDGIHWNGNKIGVRRGVSKGVENGCRLPNLRAGWPALQNIDGYGMAVPGETLGIPWPPLALHPFGMARMIPNLQT